MKKHIAYYLSVVFVFLVFLTSCIDNEYPLDRLSQILEYIENQEGGEVTLFDTLSVDKSELVGFTYLNSFGVAIFTEDNLETIINESRFVRYEEGIYVGLIGLVDTDNISTEYACIVNFNQRLESIKCLFDNYDEICYDTPGCPAILLIEYPKSTPPHF